MSCLVETWVSQASARQRRGRAGRVRPGTCYRLYSQRALESWPADTVPEIARVPLEQLCLQVCGAGGNARFSYGADANMHFHYGAVGQLGAQVELLELGGIAPFLATVVEPPPVAAVSGAIAHLQVRMAGVHFPMDGGVFSPCGWRGAFPQ